MVAHKDMPVKHSSGGQIGVAVQHALSQASATLLNLSYELPDTEEHPIWRSIHTRLERLAHQPHWSNLLPFNQAVQDAWDRLLQDDSAPAVAEPLLLLLSARKPAFAAFRQAAIEDLFLCGTPYPGRLVDMYRRDVHPIMQSNGKPAPSWMVLEPLLRHYVQTLLPHMFAAHPDLCWIPLTGEEQSFLHHLRSSVVAERLSGIKRIEMLLADLLHSPTFQQQIVTSEGSSISHVQQTILLGETTMLPSPPPNLAVLYHRYLGFLLETFGVLDFRGIRQFHNVVRLRLSDVYVSLSGRRLPSRETVMRPRPARMVGKLRLKQQHPQESDTVEEAPLHAFVRHLPFLVVLGPPGAGKSTLVRSILVALAEGEGYQRFGLEEVWLPMFFPIAAFADARAAPGAHHLAPLDYLGSYYTGLSQPDYTPLFQRALQTGRALVLMDGLDEVRTERLALVRCLESFVREWDVPGNRFVATSRIAGYDESPLDDSRFVRVVIQPLTEEGIHGFITQWSNAYERASAQDLPTDPDIAEQELQRRIVARSEDLQQAVFSNPNVMELARSPFLLTILSLIHYQGASLPDRRVDLYRLCVEVLAETWNRTRSLSGREIDLYLGSEKLDERFVVNMLGPAALWMQETQPGGLVDRRDLEHQIARTMMQTDGLPAGRARRLAQSFVDLMRCDTGLLQERGYQQFGFLHLTFEEYLAARALLESVTINDPDHLIHERCVDPAWREVLRLMVASASQREAQRLLFHLMDAPTTTETCGRPVVLAGECLLDIGRTRATQHAWHAVVERLVDLLATSSPALTIRLAAGQVLGSLGDPRLLDERTGQATAGSYWCKLEAGWFWHGTERSRQLTRRVELPTACHIARFPVTNADYQRFIEAGGYGDRRWWSSAGWSFLQPGGHPSPFDNPDSPITHPSHWYHPAFNAPNQPVVGVSWYEASAYCAWLTNQGHQANWLPVTDIIRLPTSLEWERAARHTDTRSYPWGENEPDTRRASYNQVGIHAPAPVGCFPAGVAACGALDLAGNVWEWTTTQWNQLANPEQCADFSPHEKPAIRGGAFNWDKNALHCGAHYWFQSGYRQNLLGFRVLWCHQTTTSFSSP